MEILIFLLVVLFGSLLLLNWLSGNPDKGSPPGAIGLYYIDGLQELEDKKGQKLKLRFSNADTLVIDYNIRISLDKIKEVVVKTTSELVEKEKSVIGRALVGGILLGPLGAILGGMSGIGTKKEQQNNHFLIINLADGRQIMFVGHTPESETLVYVYRNYINKRIEIINSSNQTP